MRSRIVVAVTLAGMLGGCEPEADAGDAASAGGAGDGIRTARCVPAAGGCQSVVAGGRWPVAYERCDEALRSRVLALPSCGQ